MARKRRVRRRPTARRRRRAVARIHPLRRHHRRRVFRSNPHRRGRRRFHRNPGGGGGFMSTGLDLVKGAGAVLIGGGIGRKLGSLIPIGDGTNPLVNFAKQGLVAIVIRRFAPRFVGPEMARLLAIGALAGALKDVVVAQFPAAQSFLGASDAVMILPAVPGRNALRAYAPSGMEGYSDDTGDDVGMGSYTSDGYPG